MVIARQSTARTVMIGPILDADGVAVTDAVVGDFEISVNGADPVALNGSATLTHRNTGHYSLALTATDLATVGGAEIVINDTTNACAVKVITVVEEAVYDALFAASALGYVANAPVNVAQFGGNNGTFASGRPEVNTTHVGGTSQTAGNLVALINTIDDFLDTEIASILAAVDTEVAAILADTNELQTDWANGGRLDLIIDAILVDTAEIGAAGAGLTALPSAAANADAVWEEALADHSGTAGSTAEQLAAAGAAGDPWATALPGAYGSGTAGKIVGDNLNATVSSRATQTSVDAVDDFLDTEVAAILAAVDTEIAAILADTNELQTDWVDGGRLDLILDAILVDTGTTLQGELDGIQADTEDIQTRLPAALVGGRIDATVDATGLEAGALALINAEVDQAITDAALATAAALSTVSGKIDTIDDFLDTEIAAILVDTGTTLDDLVDDLEGRLTAALAAKLTAHAAGVLVVVVDAGSSTTTVVLKTVEGGAPSATSDFYNGAVIVFTSGALAGQRTDITDYVGATATATVTALTGTPAEDVTAIIC